MNPLATITYKGCPVHIAKDDAERLKQALLKKWSDRRFDIVVEGSSVKVIHVPPRGTNVIDAGGQARDMWLFAEGFMASAFLWER